MKDAMYDRLNETESYHWWFKAKREIAIGLATPFFIAEKKQNRIADIGCGTGLLLQELEPRGQVVGFDYSDKAIEYCKSKTHAKLYKMDLGVPQSGFTDRFNVVFALDIVEHIDNDEIAMNNLFSFVDEGGSAIVTVPAYQWLWSQNDINNMHKRRYSIKRLKHLAEQSGFNVEYISYYNFWLFFPAAIVRLLTKVINIDAQSGMEYNSGNTIMNGILYRIFASEKKRISRHKKYPYGLSIIMLVRRGQK